MDIPVKNPIDLLVRTIRLEATNILSFELVHPKGEALPKVAAGAHIDVHLPGGLVRSYSLAGNPHDRSRWLLGVLREANGSGGSRAMHERVRVGGSLRVNAPRNAFPLAPEAKHSILLAGGIGVTPIKAMAHALCEGGRVLRCIIVHALQPTWPLVMSCRQSCPRVNCTGILIKAIQPRGLIFLHCYPIPSRAHTFIFAGRAASWAPAKRPVPTGPVTLSTVSTSKRQHKNPRP